MPSRTNEDKIEELTKLCATFITQIEALQGSIKGMVSDNSDVQKAVGELKTTSAVITQQIIELKAWKDSVGSLTEVHTKNALLQKECEDLRKWQEDEKKRRETWGSRLWMVIPPILAVVLGYFLGKAK